MEPLRKATHRETGEHDERLVLGTIHEAGLVSRADVARQTKLTRTTVSCTYRIQLPQTDALADAMLGRIAFAGSLRVSPGPDRSPQVPDKVGLA